MVGRCRGLWPLSKLPFESEGFRAFDHNRGVGGLFLEPTLVNIESLTAITEWYGCDERPWIGERGILPRECR